MTTTTPQLHKGMKVEGTYMGIPFTGTVADRRHHSHNHETIVVTVTLDDALDDGHIVRREAGDGVLVHVLADGSGSRSYGCPNDSIRPAP